MKHLDINPLIQAVKDIELQETARALKLTGRRRTFKKNRAPRIEYHSEGAGPASAFVKSVRLPDPKTIVIEACNEDFESTFTVAAEDLYPGSLMAIVDAI